MAPDIGISYDDNKCGGLVISVRGPRRPWEDLRKKISRGLSIEDAARQTGIPLEEVYLHVSAYMGQIDTLNFQLRLVGQGAIKSALTKLTELASGEAREGMNFESTDLEAAKALAKFGIDAIKLAKAGHAPRDDDPAKRDLFDASVQDPWKLKKVE